MFRRIIPLPYAAGTSAVIFQAFPVFWQLEATGQTISIAA
jgi:hypothetical protein